MRRVIAWLDQHFEELLMAVTLSGIVIMMSLHVFCRYVLSSPLTWSEECTRYLFIWFVFSGFSYGVKNNSHIRVDILETLCPKIVPIFKWIQDLVVTVFIVYMIPAGLSSLRYFIGTGQTSAGMHLPMYFVYGSLLVALILSLLRMIQRVVCRLMNKNRKEASV